MLRLARTLLRDKPTAANPVIDQAAAKLAKLVDEIRSELIRRHQLDDAALNVPVATYDHAVDGLWVALRRGLERHLAFLHPGLDQLPAELAQAGKLDELQARARLARYAWERLFSVEGTAFTKTKLLEQAESMATLLELIERDEELRAALDAVLDGAELALLHACQQHYEDLLSHRLSKSDGPNLNELRTKLRWALVAYVNAVHSLADYDDLASHQPVLDALRPILTLRALVTRSASPETLEDELDEFVDVGLAADEEDELEDELELEGEDEVEGEDELEVAG